MSTKNELVEFFSSNSKSILEKMKRNQALWSFSFVYWEETESHLFKNNLMVLRRYHFIKFILENASQKKKKVFS